ncbi:hypothetical protein MMC29_002222 [Sticta canariensis]|nr:hypothetical protein [Sticta canariensis]
MRPPLFLIAILVCLAGAQRSDTDDNSLALGDGSSPAFSPVLVANGEDDVPSVIWNDFIELNRAFFRDSYSNENNEPQNSHSTQPDSDLEPEVEPEPVPKPDCTPMEGIPLIGTTPEVRVVIRGRSSAAIFPQPTSVATNKMYDLEKPGYRELVETKLVWTLRAKNVVGLGALTVESHYGLS